MARCFRVALIVAATALLAGCDKCGNWVRPNVPGIPASCSGDRP